MYYSFVYLSTRLSNRSTRLTIRVSIRSTRLYTRSIFCPLIVLAVLSASLFITDFQWKWQMQIQKTWYKIKKVVNTTPEYGLVAVINKPTRVTKTSTTPTDHIITNAFIYLNVEIDIVRADMSDHFPILSVTKMLSNAKSWATLNIRKRFINEISRLTFKKNSMNWNGRVFLP